MKTSFINRIKYSFGAFFYSQKLEDQNNESYWIDDMPRNYFKPLFGKVRVYNEWVSHWPFKHVSRFSDMKFVGFGFYHHSEDR